MMNMKDISSDVTPAKGSEISPVKIPKEIGEDKKPTSDIPKEIGETSEKKQEIPKEIGETSEKKQEIPKEIGETSEKKQEIPKEIGETSERMPEIPKEIGGTSEEIPEIPKEIGENNVLHPNTFYNLDGERHYIDDNGKVYRVNNDLVANNAYEIHGYKYETDDQGRIVSAEGKLQLKDHDNYRNIKDSREKIGKGDEKKTDDRGHIIGDQFNGSNGMENIVAQDHKANLKFKNLENQLAKELKMGNDVHMRVDLDYPGISYRPDSFLVNYSIDGEEFVEIFPNKREVK